LESFLEVRDALFQVTLVEKECAEVGLGGVLIVAGGISGELGLHDGDGVITVAGFLQGDAEVVIGSEGVGVGSDGVLGAIDSPLVEKSGMAFETAGENFEHAGEATLFVVDSVIVRYACESGDGKYQDDQDGQKPEAEAGHDVSIQSGDAIAGFI
jgi:hypothetical protein